MFIAKNCKDINQFSATKQGAHNRNRRLPFEYPHVNLLHNKPHPLHNSAGAPASGATTILSVSRPYECLRRITLLS